jgi:hypothetical protein
MNRMFKNKKLNRILTILLLLLLAAIIILGRIGRQNRIK